MRDGNELGSPIREQLSRGLNEQRRFNSQPVSTAGRYEVRLYNDNKQGDAPYGDLIGRVECSTS
jgi:hypothetical protein